MPAPKGRSKSATKKPSPLELVKEEIAQKQTQIDGLKSEIESIKQSLGQQDREENRLRGKLQIILPEILAHRDRDRFHLQPVEDVVDVDEGYVRFMVQHLIDDLRERQSAKTEIEERLAELEQRITEQNLNYQSILRKNLSCMRGVEKALNCTSAYEMKYIVRAIKQEMLLEEPIRRPMSAPDEEANGNLFGLTQLPAQDSETPHGVPSNYFLSSMETVKVATPRPVRKYSGATHIKTILPELRKAVCTDLSMERPNRGDWRHFAQLIGVNTETIQFWRRLELNSPMEQVLSYWKDSQSADVTLLHRILLTPQVKAYRLAKLVSEFYDVD